MNIEKPGANRKCVSISVRLWNEMESTNSICHSCGEEEPLNMTSFFIYNTVSMWIRKEVGKNKPQEKDSFCEKLWFSPF